MEPGEDCSQLLADSFEQLPVVGRKQKLLDQQTAQKVSRINAKPFLTFKYDTPYLVLLCPHFAFSRPSALRPQTCPCHGQVLRSNGDERLQEVVAYFLRFRYRGPSISDCCRRNILGRKMAGRFVRSSKYRGFNILSITSAC